VLRTAAAKSVLRFGTTPVFLDDQIALLAAWQRDLEGRLNRPVQFVQRGSYREIIDLMLADSVDVAWVCGYPFVLYERQLALVDVPKYQGAPLYRSYLIVPERDATTRSIADLRGRVFAFSDPLSNSGYLVPTYQLLQAGQALGQFFRRSFFTFAHRKVVEAVQVGLADGGSVDGYVWDTLQKQKPEATAGVRVAWRSDRFGFPPIVARANLPRAERDAVGDALMGMGRSSIGEELLVRLNVDGFERAPVSVFDGIRVMARAAERARESEKK
jgi:phosphonate transport system substrate-binding protein